MPKGSLSDRIAKRDAIIRRLRGAVHRLGLSGRATPFRKPRAKRQRRPASQNQWRGVRPRKNKPMPEFDFAPLPPASEYDVARKSFQELADGDCKFGIGDTRDPGFGFCALPRVPGMPYCEVHLRRAYVATPPRQRGSMEVSPAQVWVKQEVPA